MAKPISKEYELTATVMSQERQIRGLQRQLEDRQRELERWQLEVQEQRDRIQHLESLVYSLGS